MAGITQRSCVTLFSLWSLKKMWWGILIYNNRQHMKSSKIEVDIVSDTDILIMLLLLMITIIMLLVVLLLLPLTTKESNNYNNYNNNVIILKMITIKMKNGCALK